MKKIIPTPNNPGLVTTLLYNIRPLHIYVHAIKYRPESFDNLLQERPVKTQRRIQKLLVQAIIRKELDVVKTLLNYSTTKTLMNIKYRISGDIYFIREEYYNEIMCATHRSKSNKTRDYLTYRRLSYYITQRNFNSTAWYLTLCHDKDIINYDNGLLSYEIITMIENDINNKNDRYQSDSLDLLCSLIKKEYNLDIHARDNLIIRTLIKYGYKKAFTDCLVYIIDEYKDSFAQQSVQSMASLLHHAQSAYNGIIGSLSVQNPDEDLDSKQQNCKEMYVKVVAMCALHHIDKSPHLPLTHYLQKYYLSLGTIYEMLQRSIILQHLDYVKNISYHMSLMTIDSHIIDDITSKLKVTLEETKKDLKEYKHYFDYLQIEKHIYGALINLHISHRNKKQIKLLLNENVIDINYGNGAILKKLVSNNSENKLKDSDCAFLKWLVEECSLNIHIENNFLLHAMISRKQVLILEYIIQEGWKTLILSREDHTLDQLYDRIRDCTKTGEDKYNNSTYQYLEDIYIVRSAQYHDSFFPCVSIRSQPISDKLFKQAINMSMLHRNISYLRGLIDFQKEQCGGEDIFYQKFNKYLMGLVKPTIMSTILIRGQEDIFEKSLLNDLILYNTKTKNISNVKDIIAYINNAKTLKECINICLTDKKDKYCSMICNIIQSRLKKIELSLSAQPEDSPTTSIEIESEKIIDQLYDKIRDCTKTGEDKYNNSTYRYLEEMYIVRSAQYRYSCFPCVSIGSHPISDTLFKQAINVSMPHRNISYLGGLIDFQKEQCGGEDIFYKKFNEYLMGLVKPTVINTIFIRGPAKYAEKLINESINIFPNQHNATDNQYNPANNIVLTPDNYKKQNNDNKEKARRYQPSNGI